jgi:hypothetical protein
MGPRGAGKDDAAGGLDAINEFSHHQKLASGLSPVFASGFLQLARLELACQSGKRESDLRSQKLFDLTQAMIPTGSVYSLSD